MEVLSAYNAGSDRILSPRLLVIDAARDPERMLKVLMGGLAPEARNGIWLVNFPGVPIVQATSTFDLIYLDQEYRVLQAIEIAPGKEFEPLVGLPASALILQPKTVARSRTFTGDRITLDTVQTRSIEPAHSSKRAAQLSPRVRSISAPTQIRQAARSTSSVPSGRLLRGGKHEVDAPVTPSPEVRQGMPVSNSGSSSGASAPSAGVEQVTTRDAATPSKSTPKPPAAGPGAKPSRGASRLIAPIPRDFAPSAPEATRSAAETHLEPKQWMTPTSREIAPAFPDTASVDMQMKLGPAVVTHSFPATRVAPQEPAQSAQQAQARMTQQPEDNVQSTIPAEQTSHGIRSWLFSGEWNARRTRRAPRIDSPGLVGYYFTGGNSVPHEIRNISVLGFYMVTDQRWMPGTVVRVTLQSLDGESEDSPFSITVFSRVVYWGRDGGGFEFVFVAPAA